MSDALASRLALELPPLFLEPHADFICISVLGLRGCELGLRIQHGIQLHELIGPCSLPLQRLDEARRIPSHVLAVVHGAFEGCVIAAPSRALPCATAHDFGDGKSAHFTSF